MSETTGGTREMGECTKCRSEIPLEADRCPECGFEPSVGLLGQLLVWVSLMLGSTAGVIALAALVVIADGFPVIDGLIAAGIFGFISLYFFAYIYSKWKVHNQTPAVHPDELTKEKDADSSSFSSEIRESWREGQERGDRIRERVDALPSIIWVIGIFVGTGFGIATWVLAAQELEVAMTIAITGSIVLVPFSILADIGRLNRTTDREYRWWVWALPAVLPVIGFVFGWVWLARKRQTTGSAL